MGPVAFTSRTLQGGELHYPAIEKEATAITEPIRKWFHLLLRKTATLVTDQRSVAFTFDSRRNSKIKNNKVQSLEWNWHRTLTRLSKDQEKKFGPDTLCRAFCATLTESWPT